MNANRFLHCVKFSCLLAVLAFGCIGCSPATKVLGTWDIDSSKPIPPEFLQANPDVGMFLAVAKPLFQIKFEGDGNLSLKYGVGPWKGDGKGSWRYVKADGKTLLLMIKQTGQTDESELRFTPVDNEHAEIEFPLPFGKKPMPFSFVKTKPVD